MGDYIVEEANLNGELIFEEKTAWRIFEENRQRWRCCYKFSMA